MIRRLAILLLLATIGSVVAACHAPRTEDPEQAVTSYYGGLRVLADGTVDVRENFILGADSRGADAFHRRIPVDHFDRIDQIEFVLNKPHETPIPPDRSAGLDVTIPLNGTRAASRIELAYRVSGAIAVRGGRGLLTWPLFPRDHPFAIETASVGLGLPDRMSLAAMPTGPGPRWKVTPDGPGWRFDATGLPAREPIVLSIELAIDPNEVSEPEWQALETRTRQLMPAFVSAALFILVTGAGIVFMIRWQFSSRATDELSRELDVAATARGLVVSAWVLIVLGVAGAAATWVWLTYFGPWPVVVPLSVVVVGAAFFPEAARLRRTGGQ